MIRSDPVDRALELLRDAQGPLLPDPVLEARLRARHGTTQSHLLRVLVRAAAIALLAGVALTASGGWRWVARWWYDVEIDGERASGSIEGDGERHLHFASEGGETGTVSVRRAHDADGRLRTQLDVHREGAGGVEHERSARVSGPPRASLSTSELEAAVPIHDQLDRAGTRVRVLALADGLHGSRLILQRVPAPETVGSECALEIARVPFDVLAPGAQTRIVELEGGVLDLSFEDGRGSVLKFAWTLTPNPTPRPPHDVQELSTPDGRVRVRVGTEPPR